MRYYNGDNYEGEWLNDRRHGQGKQQYVEARISRSVSVIRAGRYTVGGVYDGAWAYDKRNGQGTMVYRNGDKYTGIPFPFFREPCRVRCN